MKHVLLLALLITNVGFAYQLPFIHYTSENPINPLPSSSVMKTIQDDQGFIWIAVVSSGLVRYDGQQMVEFKISQGLPDLNVTDVLQSRDGHLWVATDSGLVVSEKPLSQYRHVSQIQFVKQLGDLILLNGSIHENLIIADQKNGVWVGTLNEGLVYYYLDKAKIWRQKTWSTQFSFNQNAAIQAITLNDHIPIIALENNNQSVMVTFNQRQDKLIISQNGPCRISALALSSTEKLWIGCKTGEIYYFNAEFKKIKFENSFEISAFESINQQYLWVSTIGRGIFVIKDLDNEVVHHYAAANGLLNDYVRNVYQDYEGNIWISQFAGLSKLRNNFEAFQHFSTHKKSGAEIFSVFIPDAEKAADTFWLGTDNGLKKIQANTIKPTVSSQYLKNKKINCICQQDAHSLWIGSNHGILEIVDGVTHPPLGNDKTEMFSCQQVMLENQLSLWFTGEQRISAFIKGNWYRFDQQSGLPSSSFYALAVDDENKLWVATATEGIYQSIDALDMNRIKNAAVKINENEFHIKNMMFKPFWNQSNGAPSNIIRSLLWHRSKMWVGTSRGLAILSSPMLPVTLIDEKNGLPNENIYSLSLSPKSQNVWLGTNKGLVEIETDTMQVVSAVSKLDGLVDNEIWAWNSLRSDQAGHLYFGTPKGLTKYYPEKDKLNTNPPKLQFTQLDYSENATGNQFITAFAGLSFFNEATLKYQYRLNGYQNQWSALSNSASTRYMNIPAYFFPKSFQFEVKAQNYHGIWSQPIHFTFKVNPYWWSRWWVILLVVSGLILSAWQLYRYRLKQLEKRNFELAQVNVQLKEVDQMKDAFMANTSHELRTPLFGIIGITESLLEGVAGPISAKLSNNLVTIAGSGRRLINLVNDIIDYSQFKKKEITIRRVPVELRSIIESVILLMEPLVANKLVMLVNDLPKEMPAVWGDNDRLQQVLLNLIGNAIKFTHEGEVKISSDTLGDKVRIYICDSGIGIPEDKLDNIFHSFAQVDDAISREFGGAGLGLSISQHIIKLHGSEIKVRSRIDEGSSFYFDLDRCDETIDSYVENTKLLFHYQDRMEALEADNDDTGHEYEIMVVDDEPVNLHVITNQLKLANFGVVQVSDPDEVVYVIKSRKPDLLLLDIMMPRISGYEICKIIRELYNTTELPIIMLTAKSQDAAVCESFDVGANDFLTKPFSPKALISRIKAQLNVSTLTRELHESNVNLEQKVKARTQALELMNNELIIEVRERKSAQAELAKMAFYDGLTGLANRALLYERINHAMTTTRRLNTIVAILYLDLDGFKLVNDTYGHQAGDVVLKESANRLKDIVRANDTVSRLGGDEFVILFEGITDVSMSEKFAQRVIDSIIQPVIFNEVVVNVGTSIGIALYPTHGDHAEALIQAADHAMYEAKRNGKGQYRMAKV